MSTGIHCGYDVSWVPVLLLSLPQHDSLDPPKLWTKIRSSFFRWSLARFLSGILSQWLKHDKYPDTHKVTL